MPVYDLNDFHVRAHLALFRRWPVAAAPGAHAPARRRTHDRFDREVDPDNILSLSERARRAEAARKAFYARRAYHAAQNRRSR